ncbi:DUF2946 domain-containing protein [Pseudomonas baetica]|uniref:DUF2946 domain-containing protein n=1 Tax=Pseudomonas baetica TaxID=674054 RepID=UPI002405C3A9|nr:DUF2946 domain-containing protein [Pseudomonas baetica]MDF9776570.1 flagellar biosynthesis protein FliR [Pseudomonas baetica]
MSRHRLAIAWIACFAVLFNMLAMPMSGAMAQTVKSPAEQLLWGSFCSSSGTRMVAISIGDLEQKAPQSDDHSNMQHCWCCSGFCAIGGVAGACATAVFRALRIQPKPARHLAPKPFTAPAMAESQPTCVPSGVIFSRN